MSLCCFVENRAQHVSHIRLHIHVHPEHKHARHFQLNNQLPSFSHQRDRTAPSTGLKCSGFRMLRRCTISTHARAMNLGRAAACSSLILPRSFLLDLLLLDPASILPDRGNIDMCRWLALPLLLPSARIPAVSARIAARFRHFTERFLRPPRFVDQRAGPLSGSAQARPPVVPTDSASCPAAGVSRRRWPPWSRSCWR